MITEQLNRDTTEKHIRYVGVRPKVNADGSSVVGPKSKSKSLTTSTRALAADMQYREMKSDLKNIKNNAI